MEPENVTVWAEIHLIPTSEGGRLNPAPAGSSYRPLHNFWPDETHKEMAAGIINLKPETSLPLDQSTETEIMFFVWPRLLHELYPGREWRIQDGYKIVGYGKILKILS